MALKLYNTLSKKLEEFIPLKAGTVKLYSCGLTVQGAPHLGHMRAYIVRDVLVRWFEYLGYRIMTLENFTDIDDKIIEKQRTLKRDWRVIAEENIAKYFRSCERLNIKKADFYPRASQHIQEIIELVQQLIDKGNAYEKGGDVYFRVRSFPDYGRLSGKSIDQLIAGVRVEPTEHKEDPLDFALWKVAKPGEPYWLSPWGKGRPGWHIECSAMSMHYLGATFDIHMGGEDLIFPHHENEIAQSSAATGKSFARYWLHNGWVTLGGEKMAKSTGHYFLIEDLLKEHNPNAIRLYLLKTHYRNQIEFSEERLKEAEAAYLRIQTFLQRYKEIPEIEKPLMFEEFSSALNDDLNTSRALGVIYELVTKGYEKNDKKVMASVLHYMKILGFIQEPIVLPYETLRAILINVHKRIEEQGNKELHDLLREYLFHTSENVEHQNELSSFIINILLQIRNELRRKKDYEFADYIRQQLAQHSIQIQDIDNKTTIYRWEAR